MSSSPFFSNLEEPPKRKASQTKQGAGYIHREWKFFVLECSHKYELSTQVAQTRLPNLKVLFDTLKGYEITGSLFCVDSKSCECVKCHSNILRKKVVRSLWLSLTLLLSKDVSREISFIVGPVCLEEGWKG